MEQHDTRGQGEDEQNVNEKNIKENKIWKNIRKEELRKTYKPKFTNYHTVVFIRSVTKYELYTYKYICVCVCVCVCVCIQGYS